jgi:hypothetical protein
MLWRLEKKGNHDEQVHLPDAPRDAERQTGKMAEMWNAIGSKK